MTEIIIAFFLYVVILTVGLYLLPFFLGLVALIAAGPYYLFNKLFGKEDV